MPLGERAIPGIVQPIEIWRIPVSERQGEGDLPLSFAE